MPQKRDAHAGGVYARNNYWWYMGKRTQAEVLSEQGSSVCTVFGRAHAVQVHDGESGDDSSADGSINSGSGTRKLQRSFSELAPAQHVAQVELPGGTDTSKGTV